MTPEEPLPKLRELLVADPGDAPQIRQRARHPPSDLAQDGVAEDDVGRNVAFVGDFPPEAAEPLERRRLAVGPRRDGDPLGRASSILCALGRRRALPNDDGSALGERSPTGGRDRCDVIPGGIAFDQTESNEFFGDMTPGAAVQVRADTERRKPVVAHPPDLIVFRAEQDVDRVREPHTESACLTDPQQTRQQFLRRNGRIVLGSWLEAVVAPTARDIGKTLAEIGQQRCAATAFAVGVALDVGELRTRSRRLFLRCRFIQEPLQLDQIAVAEEQDALRGQAVASRAPGLLVVALETLGDVVVNHVAYVALVDPHAEGDRRADNGRVVSGKRLLMTAAPRRVEPGVVRQGRDAGGAQRFGETLGPGAALRVDDAAFGRALLHERDDRGEGALFGAHAVRQIRAVEARDVQARVPHPESVQDVVPDARVCGRRQGDHGDRRKAFADFAKAPVFRAKVMTPLADAVRFVDRETRHAPTRQVAQKPFEQQPLRSHVEQPEVAGAEAL